MKEPTSETVRRLRTAVSDITEDHRARGFFPSAVVRVFTAGETLSAQAFGEAAVDTVFDVASLTKIATATMVLRAMDRGSLRLEDGILQVLPQLSGYPLLHGRLAGVTLRQLLTHTSGIAAWYPFYVETGDFASALSAALARYGPVEGMVYSDLNFMLLGKALESVHGMPLDRCLAEQLTGPLALGRVTFGADPAWDIAPSCYGNPIEETMCREGGFTFSRWRPHAPVRGEANDGNAYYYFGGVAGSAGIFADAAGFERLARYHMTTDSPLLIRAQAEWAPTRGLGWQRGALYPDGCGHTGFTGTSVYLSRAQGFGVVAFTNRLFYPQANPNPTNAFRQALHSAVYEILAGH